MVVVQMIGVLRVVILMLDVLVLDILSILGVWIYFWGFFIVEFWYLCVLWLVLLLVLFVVVFVFLLFSLDCCVGGFVDDLYYCVYIWFGVIDLGNLLFSQMWVVEVWNVYFDGCILEVIIFQGLDGVMLIQFEVLLIMFGVLEFCIYQVSILINGVLMIVGQYVFDFGDEELILWFFGCCVVFWFFIFQMKFREFLEWQMDLLQVYLFEQCLVFCMVFRQCFLYEFQFNLYQFFWVKVISMQWVYWVYGVLVWGEVICFGIVLEGQICFDFDVFSVDYWNNDIVLLWQDDEILLIVEVLSVDVFGLELKVLIGCFFENVYVMLFWYVCILNGFEFVCWFDDMIQVCVEFLVMNNVDLVVFVGLFQYWGCDVFMDRFVMLFDLLEKIIWLVDQFDNGFGLIIVDLQCGYLESIQIIGLDVLLRVEVWCYCIWFYVCCGKQKGFWLLSWNWDFQVFINVDLVVMVLMVCLIGYLFYYGIIDFMFVLIDGMVLYNCVLFGLIDMDGNEVLLFVVGFGRGFVMFEIDLFCFMCYVCLDFDSVEIIYLYVGCCSSMIFVIEMFEGD